MAGGSGASPLARLHAVLAGGPVEEPLVAPRFCAAAGEVGGLSPSAFHHSATKMANLLRDVQRGSGVDLVWAESGSSLELESLGQPLDWSTFPPQPAGPLHLSAESTKRLAIVIDTIGRLRTMLGDRAGVAVAFAGPQRMTRLIAGAITREEAASHLVALTRSVCEAGANLLLLEEDPEDIPRDLSSYAMATGPIWATARFYQCLPVLSLAGAADGWAAGLEEIGPAAVPCFDPYQSPRLLQAAAGRQFGLALPIEQLRSRASEAALASGQCIVMTSESELTGRIGIGEARKITLRLRNLIQQVDSPATGR